MNYIYFIILIFLLLILLLHLLSILVSHLGGCPYLAASDRIIRKSLQIAGLKSQENFYDLGSGLGKTLVIASREFNSNCVGLEIAPLQYLISKILFWGNKKVKIIPQNILSADLSQADVIYCYLIPDLIKRIAWQKKKLKKGTRIVSLIFPIEKLGQAQIFTLDGQKIYFYRT